ncbi:MAG: hypothetical protein CVV64_01325 [Candidatus Wallbacteria bacterium HGW-Wallbacteria-1]|uniref:Uncharacterized protein n=1 Tax=Candidatus Wallbacteria bacterium HGW-Wallbacteria-1 TaxID=2013854 RepID=A0A2N1PUS0_9BACT|nr:MAG: hypothetical protein CVV64_01325 [Candidatus Wallbacteria bacterium HGW-Wallbacteria-1]
MNSGLFSFCFCEDTLFTTPQIDTVYGLCYSENGLCQSNGTIASYAFSNINMTPPGGFHASNLSNL